MNGTSKQVEFYGNVGGITSSQAAIANDTDVRRFSRTLTLTKTTTLNFTIRDDLVSNNTGGVAIYVSAAP